RVNYWFGQQAVQNNAGNLIPLVGKYDGPSYPIFVDPFGAGLNAGPLGKWKSSPGIPRTGVSFVPTGPLPAQAFRWFSLLDDMNYINPSDASLKYGTPTNDVLTVPVERQGKYTWAYMLQRPRYLDPAVVDLTVVVYSSRSFQTPFGEYAYPQVNF